MGKVNSKIDTFLSVVLILEKVNKESFVNYLKDLQKYLIRYYTDYEIIIVDQRSTDLTPQEQTDILRSLFSIRWIKLAFAVDFDVALSVGLENAIGDHTILMRPNIDPIEIINEMVGKSIRGFDVVVGIANRPRTIGYKMVRYVIDGMLKSIEYNIPKNATPVRCLSRRAINTILQSGKIHHQFFIRVANIGYATDVHNYRLLENSVIEKSTIFSGITQTLKLLIFNSTKPLRWISILGISGSFSAFLFALYSIVINFLKSDVIEGWTSIVCFISFLFMIAFIILAFLGEYLARLLNESTNQKSYYISSEENSSVLFEEDRLNVID